MKKSLFAAIFIFIFSLTLPISSFAQGMMNNAANIDIATSQNNDEHTAREEAQGKAVWEKLQSKELACKDLTDDNFETLGEYFMGQMLGDSHEAMNDMMIRMMDEKGEEQAHIAMGKRLSGCDISAAFLSHNNSTNNMMNFGSGFFVGFGRMFTILWWVLIIFSIVALVKWLTSQPRGSRDHKKSPLEILKERYAKGEIDKKEFEEKKKDLLN